LSRDAVLPATLPVGWVLRAVITLHLVAIVGQPIFAGVYLSGDYDALSMHAAGADVVTGIGYVQLIVAIVVWRRLRVLWPLISSAIVAAAETLQYYAGMHGPLWLHIPLGVMIVVAVVVQFLAAWLRPLARRGAVT
jgi:hypothetical protein